MPSRKEVSKALSVSVKTELADKAHRRAKQRGLSMNQYLKALILWDTGEMPGDNQTIQEWTRGR